jgi:D-xylonolactonase
MTRTRPVHLEVEVVQNAGLACGEGPMWDPVRARLYWTDAGGQAVYQLDRATGMVSLLVDLIHTASVALHADGGLVLGGAGGFHAWHPGTGLRPVATTCDGQAISRVNDVIADERGRVFGGQEAFREDQAYELGYLYRVDPDGSVSIVEEGLHLSNGMGFSPDGRSFYLVDSIARRLYAYDYHAASGAIRNRRVLVQLAQEDGLPDGMTVDADGYLWVARWFGGGLSRFDPDGNLERVVALPVAQPSSVMFGGPDLDELYVTSAAMHWVSPVAPADHDYSQPRGGPLLRLRPGVRGRVEHAAAV